MLIFGATTATTSCCSYGGYSVICQQRRQHHYKKGEAVTCMISSGGDVKRRSSHWTSPLPMQMMKAAVAVSAVSLAVMLAVVEADANSMEIGTPQLESEETGTLSNVPQTLSTDDCISGDCKKTRIQRPKSRKAEVCTIKCVTTCIQGGLGSPGEGPLNASGGFQARIPKPSILFGRVL
ncbi:hypothetical protein M9H77_26739 [Catharanthus roseus]|uniref:Uncharacterized protein n=1 Tax=Catharanthus roseus TaxID=4058 RepID=A0ACC0AEL4_CATRO|nr:hypothetical protein M9H77_26739 [Catharanthus roseus]